MKKLIALTVSLVFVFSSIFFPLNKTFAVDSTKDQANDSEIGSGYLTLLTSSTTRAQTFSPTMTHLTQIDIYLKDRVNGSWVEIALINEPTSEVVATAGTRMGAGDGWESIYFDATVDINNVYRMKAYNNSALNVKWTYTNNNYNGGFMYYGENTFDENSDMNFRTYGYNDPAPAEEPADTENTAEDETTSETATTETLGQESASITKPTSLDAKFSDEKKAVELSWKASATADIDGYKIFRSESYSKGYVKISDTKKDILSYLDEDYTAGKTYYYQVRAYKGSEQSASSNIASATVPSDVAPAKPKVSVIDTTPNSLTARWKKSEATNLAGYTINLYKGSEKVRTKDLSAKANEYSFLDLDAGTLYKIELIAKDNEGKTSSPAYAFGITKLPEWWVQIASTFNLAASLVIIVLIGFLVASTIKTMKKKKV